MSSTNSTSNYELSQFIGSDKPAWLADYNSDMGKIDAQMKLNADAASTADGKGDTNAAAIGTLANLSTTAKTNLVAAINEVDTNAGTAQNTATNAQTTANAAKTTADGIVDNFDFNQGTTCTVTSSNINISAGSTTLTSFANDTGSIGKIYGRVKGTTNASSVSITFNSELRPTSSINIDGFCLAYHPESQSNTKAIIKMPSITIGTDGTCSVSLTDVAVGVEINFYFFAGLIFAKNLGDSIVTS